MAACDDADVLVVVDVAVAVRAEGGHCAEATMVPAKRLNDKSNNVRFAEWNISAGIVPVSILWDKSKPCSVVVDVVKDVKEDANIVGMVPVNWFPDNAKKVKAGKSVKRHAGSDPPKAVVSKYDAYTPKTDKKANGFERQDVAVCKPDNKSSEALRLRHNAAPGNVPLKQLAFKIND